MLKAKNKISKEQDIWNSIWVTCYEYSFEVRDMKPSAKKEPRSHETYENHFMTQINVEIFPTAKALKIQRIHLLEHLSSA